MVILREGSHLPLTGDNPIYHVLRQVGRGGYGTVHKAIHVASNDIVAIKHIAWERLRAESRRILREIIILKHLRHPHLICCLDLFTIPLPGEPDPKAFDLCIVMPYVVKTMCEKNNEDYSTPCEELNEVRIVTHLYYLLRGLDYYHKCGLVHRDLGPRNILVNHPSHPRDPLELYIADFGMAREDSVGASDQTFYVTTRPYRAPELITARKTYSSPIDIWAVGCIAAEMLTGSRLFNIPSARDASGRWSGVRAGEQLMQVLRVIGSPTLDAIADEPDPNVRSFLGNPDVQKLTSDLTRHIHSKLRAKIPLESVAHIIQMIELCLDYTSTRRPSAETLLSSFPLFKKHNLVLPPQTAVRPCTALPSDLAKETVEVVLIKLAKECRGNMYSPFTMAPTTARGVAYSLRLQTWESAELCRGVLADLNAEIMAIDGELGDCSEEERGGLMATAYELLDIQQRLEKFAAPTVPDDEAVPNNNDNAEGGMVFNHDDDEEQESQDNNEW